MPIAVLAVLSKVLKYPALFRLATYHYSKPTYVPNLTTPPNNIESAIRLTNAANQCLHQMNIP
jgi:hypothetical protein